MLFLLTACSTEETTEEIEEITDPALIIISESALEMTEDQKHSFTIEVNSTSTDTHFEVVEIADNLNAEFEENVLSITPAPDFFGSSTLSIKATNGDRSTSQSITVDVLPVNDNPTINTIEPLTLVAGETQTLSIKADDVDADELTYMATTTVTGLGVAIDAKGQLTLSTEAYLDAEGAVEVTVSDGQASESISIDVTIFDDSFEFAEQSFSFDEDTTQTLPIKMRNERNTASFSIVEVGEGLTANITGDSIQFIPNLNFYGTSEVTIRAQEIDGNRDIQQTFSIEVVSINDSPSINFPTDITARYNVTKSFQVDIQDADDDIQSIRILNDNDNIEVSLSDTNQLSVFATEQAAAASTISIEVKDQSSTTIHDVQLSLLPSIRILGAENLSIQEDGEVTLNLFLSDGSIENPTFAISESNENLTTTIDDFGILVITPVENFYGEVTLAVKASFGQESINQEIPVIVEGVNDKPVINELPDIVMDENDQVTDYQIPVTDPDSEVFSFYFKADRRLNPSINDDGVLLLSPEPGLVGEFTMSIFVDDDIDYDVKELKININQVTYFAASDGTHGQELWRTNGFADGTYLVKDINSGLSHSYPSSFTQYNGLTYFVADDGVHGYELWRTDGTEVGTELVFDMANSEQSASIRDLTAGVDGLYFTVQDISGETTDRHIYKTQGSEETTTLVTDKTYSPSNLFSTERNLYFVDGTELYGWEVYAITSEQTDGEFTVVKDINPGVFAGVDNANFIATTLGNELIFAAWDGVTQGIWKTDGTESGTRKLTGANSVRYDNLPILTLDDAVYYTIHNNETGVQYIYQYQYFEPGSTTIYNSLVFSSADEFSETPLSAEFTGFSIQNGILRWSLHAAWEGTSEHNVYQRNNGTIIGSNLQSGMSSKQTTYFVGEQVFMLISDEDNDLDDTSDMKLWATHWNDEESTLAEPAVVFNPVIGVDAGDILFDLGWTLGTSIDPNRTASSSSGVLLFTGYTVESGWEVYTSDGTVEGTSNIFDINPGTDGAINWRIPFIPEAQ